MSQRIAIFHNYLDNIGGAETVSLFLARELGADIYTTNIDSEKIALMGFGDVLPRIFSVGKVPLNAPFRQQLALLYFRFLHLKNQYDFFIIAGDWAVSGAVNNKPNLWYVHSPIREIWDLNKYVRNTLVAPWKRPLFDMWVKVNRYLNKKYVAKVQTIACNSETTRARVETYLQRKAAVIHPPVDTKQFRYESNGDYWLSVNRLISHKRIDMQLDAFRNMPDEKLVIVGSYEQSAHFKAYAEMCKKNKPENVDIRSWVSQTELVDLYANCKGFITTSKEEDFGLNAVEAMASGKPVIAPNEGGYRETVVDGKTGLLIDNISAEKIMSAVETISNDPEAYKNACLEQAKKFDLSIFIGKIKKLTN
jgi:glycosyltransferase involved in cell wall biosynthesis